MVHQSRVKACPQNFPGGFYWYGGRRHGLGKPPQWVEDLLADQLSYQGTGTNGESEAVGTSDLEDGDANCSESDQSDADIDEENSTDTEG